MNRTFFLIRLPVWAEILSVAAALWLLFALLPVFGAEPKADKLPKESIKPLTLAQQAGIEKDYVKAILILSEYMAQAKEAIPLQAYQMLVNAYYQNKDIEKARKACEDGHGAFPNDAEMFRNYAILTYETGRLNEAAGLFEKLYRLKGESDKKVLYQASGLYYKDGNRSEAKRLLGELLASGSTLDPKWYEDMIAICVELKQWNEAEKWATAFLEQDPERSEYWLLLAQMRLDRQEYQAAAVALENAYQLKNPKQSRWLDLSDLYMYHLNAPLMAIRCMKNAYGNEISADKLLKIARAYASNFRFDDSAKTADEAYQKNPEAYRLLEKGRRFYNAMDYKAAITALQECIKIDPEKDEAWMLMGFAAWNLKKWDEARSAFVFASALPKYRDQAKDAMNVLDCMIELLKQSTDVTY